MGHATVTAAGAVLGLIVAACGAEGPKKTGRIDGVVRYTGVVPAAKKLPTFDGFILQRDLTVDAGSKGLRDVVAALSDAPAQPKLGKAELAYVDQKDLVFVPRVVAVQHGRAVRFDNNDLCNHSVMAVSTVKGNSFNLFVAAGKPLDHVFEVQKHPVQIGCSLHSWMSARVYVFAHPWFAISDRAGGFTIKDVPPGKYTLWLRHPDTSLQEKRPVEVRAGETTRIEVTWREAPK